MTRHYSYRQILALRILAMAFWKASFNRKIQRNMNLFSKIENRCHENIAKQAQLVILAKRLIPLLLEMNHNLVCCVRDKERVRRSG